MADLDVIEPIPRLDPIVAIGKDELVEGGLEGAANRPIIALANQIAYMMDRTYSKTDVDDLAAILQEMISAAEKGLLFFETTAELLATNQGTENRAAQARDTSKIYLWKITSAAGVTPVVWGWVDTGSSDKDQILGLLNENGLYTPKALKAGDDLDNLTEGYFKILSGASSVLNVPEVENGAGFTVKGVEGESQWYFSQPTNNLYFRSKWSSGWKPWRAIIDSSQVPLPQSQKTGNQTLSDYKGQGIYNFASTAVISDLPSDAPTGVPFTMKVETYVSGGRSNMQILKCDQGTQAGQMWERTLDAQTGAVGAWRFYSRLHRKQVLPDNLDTSFRYRGAFSAVNVSDYLDDGIYTFTDPTDKPSTASSGVGLVDVQNWFNSTFVIQSWITKNSPEEHFIRLISSSGVGAWKKTTVNQADIMTTQPQITGSQALTTFKDQGIYNFAPDAVISDLPSGVQANQSYTLETKNYIKDSRFRLQRLRCDSGTYIGRKWERRLDTQNSTATAWIADSQLHDKQVGPANLADSWRYKGGFTSVIMSEYRADGLYTFITAQDMPELASGTSGLVDVQNWYSGSFVIQTWTTSTKPDEKFVRLLRPTTIGEWKKLGAGGESITPFSGKKILSFGDSITEFGTYPQQIGARLGGVGYNIGFGGCRWAKHTTALYNEMCMYRVADYIANDNLNGLMDAAIALRDSTHADDNTAQVARLQSIDLSSVDYVTIFYGTNDFAGLIPIGTDDDATGETFKGAINISLDKLLTKYPNWKILLVTPIWRSRKHSGDGLESDSNPNELGLYLRDYVQAIKDMGKKYHLPVLDLYDNSGFNKYTKDLYLSTDGLHPSSAGYTHLANLIAAKLASTY